MFIYHVQATCNLFTLLLSLSPVRSGCLSLGPEVNALENAGALEMRAGLDRTASWVFITPNKKQIYSAFTWLM